MSASICLHVYRLKRVHDRTRIVVFLFPTCGCDRNWGSESGICSWGIWWFNRFNSEILGLTQFSDKLTLSKNHIIDHSWSAIYIIMYILLYPTLYPIYRWYSHLQVVSIHDLLIIVNLRYPKKHSCLVHVTIDSKKKY